MVYLHPKLISTVVILDAASAKTHDVSWVMLGRYSLWGPDGLQQYISPGHPYF